MQLTHKRDENEDFKYVLNLYTNRLLLVSFNNAKLCIVSIYTHYIHIKHGIVSICTLKVIKNESFPNKKN